MSPETAPAAAPAPEAPKEPKNQAAVQVPLYGQKIAQTLSKKLDEKGKHVIGAALLLLEQQDAQTQVQLLYAAKIKYAETTPTAA